MMLDLSLNFSRNRMVDGGGETIRNGSKPMNKQHDKMVEAASYFACDFDQQVEFFSTEAEAKKYAENALEEAGEQAADGSWPENTTEICYGRVLGSVECVKSIPRPPESIIDADTGQDADGNEWQDTWSRIDWHELKSTKEPFATALRALVDAVDDLQTEPTVKNRVMDKVNRIEEALAQAKALVDTSLTGE